MSWLKEFVDIDIPAEALAEKLTVAGLEVGSIVYIGVPQTQVDGIRQPTSNHLVWDRERLVLAGIREIKPHPNADRLVIAMVDYGGKDLEPCVTGAPNLFEYRGKGELNPPLWTAFAHEGAEVWDGHSDEPKRMILKGKDLRGVFNKSMVCSEKELGIAEDHDGVILMHDQPRGLDGKLFPAGAPLADVLGDILLEVELTPNLARCFSVLGVAREVAALLDKPLRQPNYDFLAEGEPIAGQVQIDIRNSDLNQRFVLALLKNTTIRPSPEWMQRRLKLVGQRPINNIVDVTNYITFELGQPLHAFDYDKLVERAGGKAPTIITRMATEGETLLTLDGQNRNLEAHNILVCDTEGVLGLGGIMGGGETEISDSTTTVLLEGANWNFINIRRSMQSQKIFTEAGTRYSRGVHPSQAILGVSRGIELMRTSGGGVVAKGLIDEYPKKAKRIAITLYISEVRRWLGMDFDAQTAANMLLRLGFEVTIKGESLDVIAPDHRMDISDDPIIGQADLIEEIARIYGYDAIPTTIMDDAMPPQWVNVTFEREERLRDVLVDLGVRENISYRFTTPEIESGLVPNGMSGNAPYDPARYVTMLNPISPEKTVFRQSLLPNMLQTVLANRRYQTRQLVFEIGSIYQTTSAELPDELRRLAVIITGSRDIGSWLGRVDGDFDFFDIKGIVEGIAHGLHLPDVRYEPNSGENTHISLHPGRSAVLYSGKTRIGAFGELHPLVARAFDLGGSPVLVVDFDLDALLATSRFDFNVKPLPITPPVFEDLALVVRDDMTASQVEAVIRKAGGELLKDVTLFDVYRGDSIPTGHKSLAYSLVYQTDDKTLTDKEVLTVRKKIIGAVEHQLGAKLRA
jgi:phenylalanyl-tRNA synthetase beta chain